MSSTENKPKKYIFINGVMKLNPEYNLSTTNSTISTSSQTSHSSSSSIAPLAIISNFNDLEEAKEAQQVNGGTGDIQLPLSTSTAIEMIMSDTYSLQYSITQQNNLFDGLCNYFTMYEIPIGLISRLLELRNYRLNFMIDDSGNSILFYFYLFILLF